MKRWMQTTLKTGVDGKMKELKQLQKLQDRLDTDTDLLYPVEVYAGRNSVYFRDTDHGFTYPCRLVLEGPQDKVTDYLYDSIVTELNKGRQTWEDRGQDEEVRLEFTECVEHGMRLYFERCFDFIEDGKVEDGMALEFGVFSGKSVSLLSEYFSEVYGFDTFTGLPSDWVKGPDTVVPKGKFTLFGEYPQVPQNVFLHKGLFEDTIDDVVKEPIMFMHVDCDLYESAVTVFEKCNEFIVPGTVIVMDDYRPIRDDIYPNWREGEYKAMNEWKVKYGREVRPVLRNGFQSYCFVVDK